MSMKEVFLEGNPPWGFRMNGGADAGHPLRISRVNPGSKAEAKGVREGDLITSINGQSTKCLTNSESHALLRTVKENLLLGLNEDKNASPRRRSREIKSASIISQEKDRSESPAQTKGNKKPSANQKRHQRRTRLRHRIKEMLGLKTKGKAGPDDEEWVIVDASLKSETKSLTNSLPEDEGSFQFIRSNSAPVRNDPEEVYDNFDFKTQGIASDSRKKNEQHDGTTSTSEKNVALNEGDNENLISKDPRQNDDSLPVSENISSHYQNQISFRQTSTVKHSENVKNYEAKTFSYDNPCKKPSVEVIPKTSELSAVEENLSDEEEFSEILSFFPPNEMVEVCNATIMFEDDKLSPETLSQPIISLEDCGQSKFGQNSNPDYEPVEVNSSVIMYPPYSSTLSYYFPPRRLLESISEENSDVSENNDENKEKPWESSQLIREANNIDSIPDDWFGSDEGIDTSWRDGRSIEEVSDVPVVSDSHSDSDLLSEDIRINKTEDKSRFKIVNDKLKDEALKKEQVKKNDVVLGKPPINIVNTYRISGKQTNKTSTMAKSESQPPVKVENPQKEARNAGKSNHDKLISVTNSVQGDSKGSIVTCKILKQSDIHTSENKLHNDIVKCISTSVKGNENTNLKSQKAPDKTNESKLEQTVKHSNNIAAKLPCKVVYHENINSDIKSVVKSQVSSPASQPCSTKTIEPVHLKSSDTRSNNNNADASSNSKNYMKSTPSSSVLKNVVSSYYNSSAVPKKVNIHGNEDNTQSNTCLELSTNVIQPGLERDIELIYIDSSDSDAISNKSNLSVSNRTSLSLEKEEVDVLEVPVNMNANNNSKASNNSGHIIKEVISNINQSVKEISDICCETTKAKKSRLLSKSKDNEVVHKYSMLPNLLSPVLSRKCLPSKQTYSKRRFSYPFTDQDILKNGNAMNWCHLAVSTDCGGPTNKEDTLLKRNLSVEHSHESSVPITKGIKDYVHAELTKNTSLTSNKEEAKSTESIFMDFSDGSVSSESYTLPDVTHDNELLSDVSTDTIKYIGLPPSSPRFVPRSPVEVSDIVDLHKKFVERRGYHEASPVLKRKEENKRSTEPDLIALSKCQERSEQAYTPELLAEAANLLALHKYHESRQKKMRHDNKEKNEEQKLIHSDFTKPVERQKVPTVVDSKLKTNVCITQENRELLQDIRMNEKTKKDSSPNKSITTENESVGKSRLLELFQKLQLKSSSSECSLPEPFPYWLILGHDLELEPENESNTKCNGSVCSCKEEKVHCAHKIDENENSVQKHEDSASTVAKLEVTGKYIKQTTSTENKPISLPIGEIFQRRMYEEYLEKIAEMAERRSSKVIKISNVPNSVNSTSDNQPLESEFMTKLKERNEKLGIIIDNDEISDGTKKPAPEKQDLPKHLKELMEITEECGGVWSPAQTPEAERKKFDFSNEVKEEKEKEKKKEEEEKKEPQPAVWTPRSAGASPTLERKFRTVNFQSPPPSRKEIKTPNETPELPQELPVDGDKDTKSRLTSSSSENSTLSSSLRLPSAQNPTITLLQKAREGQIPRGAQYLEEQPPIFGPDEIIYSVKKEHVLEDQSKKIVELGPRKIEGIGPTTREGVPTVLRSEVKEDNQQRWYKRMYDSLHKADYDSQYPYTYSGGYASEPERIGYDSDASISKYATLDRRKIRNKENDFTTSTMPRNRYAPGVKYAVNIYKNQPGRIEDYEPGHSSIGEKETKQWWDEVMDIFDGELNNHSRRNHLSSDFSGKPYTYSLKDTGYESDSTLVFKRRENNMSGQLLSPADQKMAYKVIQKGGDVPFQGLRKAVPERPKEPLGNPIPTPPRDGTSRQRIQESPHRYVESEVNIHYRSPVRREAKAAWPEDELAQRQAEIMRRIYQEQKRTKYLNELHDMYSRRHADNLLPSQKSPIPLNRYDDFPVEVQPPRPRDRTPEPKLVARALYNFVGQTSRELSFRRGDIIYVRRQIDKNWYEGEHNAMVGLFPFNYVEIIPYDGIRTLPKKASEGQARAKFNFQAQTHLELSLVKGELVLLTRRVDENWFEGRIGNRKGIFPVSYVEVLVEPGERATSPTYGSTPSKPIVAPASHSVMLNGAKDLGQQHYQPPRPAIYASSSLPPSSKINDISLVNQTLHIDTQSDPVPYRVMYNYRPQNEDELELKEGDIVYVMEKCDDGWYVGSLHRNGQFGTFPGNYVERIQ